MRPQAVRATWAKLHKLVSVAEQMQRTSTWYAVLLARPVTEVLLVEQKKVVSPLGLDRRTWYPNAPLMLSHARSKPWVVALLSCTLEGRAQLGVRYSSTSSI